VGLVISRVGSLVVEPILKRTSFLNLAEHKDFAAASKKDSKIETLLEVNNMYRTLGTMFILLPLLKIYGWIEVQLPVLKTWDSYLLIMLLLILFLFSYRKQSEYIAKRIRANS
jgi:hypothetical protein